MQMDSLSELPTLATAVARSAAAMKQSHALHATDETQYEDDFEAESATRSNASLHGERRQPAPISGVDLTRSLLSRLPFECLECARVAGATETGARVEADDSVLLGTLQAVENPRHVRTSVAGELAEMEEPEDLSVS